MRWLLVRTLACSLKRAIICLEKKARGEHCAAFPLIG